MRRQRGWTIATVALLVGVALGASPVEATTTPRGPQPVWTRAVAGQPFAAAAGPHGISLVAGRRFVDRHHDAMFVAAYGPRGALRWLRAWRPAGCSATASAVAAAPDGSVFVGGSRSCSNEPARWFVRRYTRGGSLAWHREGGPLPGSTISDAGAYVNALAPWRGGVVVAGRDEGCCDISSGQDGWVRSIDAAGSARWISRFEFAGVPSATTDLAADVATSAAGIFVGGYVAMGRPHEPWFDWEPAVIRLTDGGRPVWQRIQRDPGGEPGGGDMVLSLVVRGRQVVTAESIVDRTRSHLRLLALGLDGSRRWARWVRGTGLDVAAWSGRLYAITMGRGTRAWVQRLGPRGLPVWTTDGSALAPEVSLWGVGANAGGVTVAGSARKPGSDWKGRVWRLPA